MNYYNPAIGKTKLQYNQSYSDIVIVTFFEMLYNNNCLASQVIYHVSRIKVGLEIIIVNLAIA